MALKILMLGHKLENRKAALEALKAKDAEFDTREAQIREAITEANSEEEERAVQELLEAYEREKSDHEGQKQGLESEIEDIEKEMEELKRSLPAPEKVQDPKKTERNVYKMSNYNIRSLPKGQKVFDALPFEERAAIVSRDDVKTFLAELRNRKGSQRAVSGGELTIPETLLDLISENMFRYSKLLNHVRVRTVNGVARQTIAGTVPEAVWTEMCAAINELKFSFNQVTVDGFKVAGFVPVCNSILEDSDINLASWIVEMLSEAVGMAIDKAIIYGKGPANKMPMGIVTRLAQTVKPSDYPANAPEWEDLHTKNVIKINPSGKTGTAFWAELMIATGNTATEYSRGEQFWAMNSKTLTELKSKLITFTANGDAVANLYGVLPIINGNVEILEFMPDGDIVGGYGELYLMSLRSEMTVESSSEVQFIQDNTVFKGKQRADGMPVIAGAFVAINIKNTEVTTVMNFAADNANDAQLLNLTIGDKTLSPAFSSDKYTYTLTADAAKNVVTATAAQADAKIAISYNGKNVENGSEVTWKTGGTPTPMTVTVRQGNAVRVYTVTVTKS